jgi:leucyl/phenylalanyl-tRNA---protein transferase
MPVYLLNESLVFPHPMLAEPDGLLAIGGDLSVQRLLLAYSSGIFPWYSDNTPILWFSPDPRLVLSLPDLHVSRRLGKIIRSGKFEVEFDMSFEDVIRSCSAVSRKGQSGTWITEEMTEAYIELHKEGYAHSAETYLDGKLVGGLYGVALGRAFFGESMFHLESDASKVALCCLVERIKDWGFDFIDSQVPNSHMKRMGGKEISRERFLEILKEALKKETLCGSWNDAASIEYVRL